jgi:hypothetical protein
MGLDKEPREVFSYSRPEPLNSSLEVMYAVDSDLTVAFM